MKGFKKNGKFHPTKNDEQKKVDIASITKVSKDIDMKDPKQVAFVEATKRRLMLSNANQLKNVKEIKIEDKRVGESLAEKDPQKDGTEKIVVRYDPSNSPEEADGLLKHELDHVEWDELEKNNPEKIHAFMLAVIEQPPFTNDLENYQKELMEAKDEDIDELSRKYFDEYHSEIGQVNDRIKLGLVKREDIEAKVDLESITKAYNNLHA